MTLQPFAYTNSLDIILRSFGCIFVCNLRRYAWYSDILVDYLCYYKVFRVRVSICAVCSKWLC